MHQFYISMIKGLIYLHNDLNTLQEFYKLLFVYFVSRPQAELLTLA